MRLPDWLRPRAARREETRTEAQLDLRDGLLEARASRIAELERLLALTQSELATYKTQDFMRQALRLRRRQAEERQAEERADPPPHPVRPGRHQARDEATEVHPRTSRGPLK